METREKNIRKELGSFIGSNDKFQLPIFKNIYYSEGIKELCRLCQSDWLLLDLVSNMVLLRKEHNFVASKIYKKEESRDCYIDYEDGNGTLIKSVKYPYTDFPLTNDVVNNLVNPAVITFYRDEILYLANEH